MPTAVPVLLMVRELGIGGCERDLAKLARALDRTRFTPFVGCFIDSGIRGDELRRTGIPILKVPVRSFTSFSALEGASVLWRFLRSEGIQVVHCFDTPTDIFAPPIARVAGVRAVVTSRLWAMDSIAPMERRMTRFAEKFADRIVVNARSTGRLVEDEGISSDRLYLCYNGVETGIFHPNRHARVAPVKDADLVVGTVCALRSEKRIDLLIDAFAALRNLRPRMQLLIVGSGPMGEQWKQRARERGLDAQCHFEPTRSDVGDWMRSMDIFVLPSDTESFPNALLEAMACGCAVIGSNVGGIPEMIAPDSCGQVFEPANLPELTAKLERAITDSTQRAAWSEAAARRAVQEFSMDRCAQRMETLYSSLLAQPGKTSPRAVVSQG